MCSTLVAVVVPPPESSCAVWQPLCRNAQVSPRYPMRPRVDNVQQGTPGYIPGHLETLELKYFGKAQEYSVVPRGKLGVTLVGVSRGTPENHHMFPEVPGVRRFILNERSHTIFVLSFPGVRRQSELGCGTESGSRAPPTHHRPRFSQALLTLPSCRPAITPPQAAHMLALCMCRQKQAFV
jgi:hypothetical protein